MASLNTQISKIELPPNRSQPLYQISPQTENRHTFPFTRLVIDHWRKLASSLQDATGVVKINGSGLTIAEVVFTARYGGSIELAPEALSKIKRSADVLRNSLKNGEVIYGVNTGFGGSADTRTADVRGLQQALLRQLQCGIVSRGDDAQAAGPVTDGKIFSGANRASYLPLGHPSGRNDMPPAWVRATMVARVNSLSGGASGIDIPTLQTLIDLHSNGILPQIPLRGSISASGDLNPLSYVAGVMQATPGLSAYVDGVLTPAQEALSIKNITPVTLGPKEGLALVNGTAVSTAVGSLVMHEVLQLATVSQVLTAMSVEALAGTDESFDPFIARVRPHVGQGDAAKNIRGFLSGSRLLCNGQSEGNSLRQDRYSLRTSSQWIGPVLEDLTLAFRQVTTEINSVTDNPLIDSDTGRHLHGGNFQARSITSAMEKVRSCCQVLGKMLYAQCTEMINPAYNRGLPPNLALDEPSESFMFKGVDIMMAALSSELGHLSAPVNHVETAEMGNQALNSLALISARYTLEAVDVLSQMCAAHLAAACQAVDLRVFQRRWSERVRSAFERMVECFLVDSVGIEEAVRFKSCAWEAFQTQLSSTSNLDSRDRISGAARSAVSLLLERGIMAQGVNSRGVISAFVEEALVVFGEARHELISEPKTPAYLGAASGRMYAVIRDLIKVPFVTEHSLHENGQIVGSDVISPIYAAIRNGSLWPHLAECLNEAEAWGATESPISSKL